MTILYFIVFITNFDTADFFRLVTVSSIYHLLFFAISSHHSSLTSNIASISTGTLSGSTWAAIDVLACLPRSGPNTLW
jgi:hypothetical protein